MIRTGDIVTVYRNYNMAFDFDWNNDWLDEMDDYIGKSSKVIAIDECSVDLLLLYEYKKSNRAVLSRSYNFPIGCIKTYRKEKIQRLIENI